MDIRSASLRKGVQLYPSYNQILEAKKLCYPTGITIKPSSAEVDLQNLLNHTNSRLIASQSDHLTDLSYDKYEVIYKWGCDESSNHSRYKQTFVEEDEDGDLREYNDSHIFSFALVPLRLKVQISANRTKTLWNNTLPSSVSLCRPIKLIFTKEEANVTREEVGKIQNQICTLKPTECAVNDRNITVCSKLIFSMMDTKVINDLTGTHSQCCYICGKSGKKLNDAAEIDDLENPEKYRHGFSPLHGYIRSMELILKVAYRLNMKKPTWRVAKTNESVRQREISIRQKLKEKLGLRISEPRPNGGNSNDGNTARKFFREWREVCEICGLNTELMERLHVILAVINSKCEINIETFTEYLEETRRLYVSKYDWYPLSPTLHKILVHGPAIVRHAILPVGMYSEEALETRNKSIRKFRENHSRKFSRTANIEDVFNRLLLTSDPMISLMNRSYNNENASVLPEAAYQLIIIPK